MQTPRTIEVPDGLIRHGGTLWMAVNSEGFVGYKPWRPPELMEITDLPTLTLGWSGGKISRAMWQQICAFCEMQYALTGGEAQGRLFYNPQTGEWKAWVFPQEWSTGMTTKELDDHPDKAAQSIAIGEGFMIWGTFHHHCKSSAFQSGVDEANEKEQNGLHITIGHIGSNKYDLHGRVYYMGVKYTCEWDNWFEYDPCPNWINHIADLGERATAAAWIRERFNNVEAVLKEPPPKNTLVPKIWMDNLIKQTYHGNGNGHYNSNGYWNGNVWVQTGGGGHSGGHGFQNAQRSYENISPSPMPFEFLSTVKRITETNTVLQDEDIRRLLEECAEKGIITSIVRPTGEAIFMDDFAKACMDTHIYPRAAAARMALQLLFPELPLGDEEEILLATYQQADDANYTYAEAVDALGSLLMNATAPGFGEVERSFYQHLRQMAGEYKVSPSEIARIFFDYSCAQDYIAFKAHEDDERLAIQEMNAEQRQLSDAAHEFYRQGGIE
jgi:hypothetical protein